jgi:ApaG protein
MTQDDHRQATHPPRVHVSMSTHFMRGPDASTAVFHYTFGYDVVIRNDGAEPATLIARHWVITDANGHVDEVRGPGVVGQSPTIEPGTSFRYSSGTTLRTATGTIQGTYLMELDDGTRFDAVVEACALVAPDNVQ